MKHRKYASKMTIESISRKINLAMFMLFVGAFTLFASFNTYEVIARRDAPFTDVITTVTLTSNRQLNTSYLDSFRTTYSSGSFGVPKKIKLPEATKHIDLSNAAYSDGWKASKGLGQYFIVDEPRQKVFGKSIIYLRTNTTTTQHLGSVYNGDIVNIVTTEGWQLGYKVTSVSDDPKNLNTTASKNNTSEITVILIDNSNGSIRSFIAELSKVGERV